MVMSRPRSAIRSRPTSPKRSHPRAERHLSLISATDLLSQEPCSSTRSRASGLTPEVTRASCLALPPARSYGAHYVAFHASAGSPQAALRPRVALAVGTAHASRDLLHRSTPLGVAPLPPRSFLRSRGVLTRRQPIEPLPSRQIQSLTPPVIPDLGPQATFFRGPERFPPRCATPRTSTLRTPSTDESRPPRRRNGVTFGPPLVFWLSRLNPASNTHSPARAS
jgi:hypothetical protein